MSKVRNVEFGVQGGTVEDIETRAREQAEKVAAGRPYSLFIGQMTPAVRDSEGQVSVWEADAEVTFDYGDKTTAAAYPSAALKPAADVRQFGTGGQVTP